MNDNYLKLFAVWSQVGIALMESGKSGKFEIRFGMNTDIVQTSVQCYAIYPPVIAFDKGIEGNGSSSYVIGYHQGYENNAVFYPQFAIYKDTLDSYQCIKADDGSGESDISTMGLIRVKESTQQFFESIYNYLVTTAPIKSLGILAFSPDIW